MGLRSTIENELAAQIYLYQLFAGPMRPTLSVDLKVDVFTNLSSCGEHIRPLVTIKGGGVVLKFRPIKWKMRA